MHILRSIAASAALVATAAAQAIAFTQWPSIAVAGKSYDLLWSGGDGSPVTIKLLTGSTDNLQTVSTLTTTGTNRLFTWVVPQTAPVGTNFALSIQDSYPNDLNYIGPIELRGGSGSLVYSSVSVQNVTSSVATSSVATSSATTSSTTTTSPTTSMYNVTTTICPTATTAALDVPTTPLSSPSIYPPIVNGAMSLAFPAGLLSICLLLCLPF